MRRLIAFVVALGLTASLGGAAAADTTGGCFSPTGQCRTTGRGVDALWTTVPDAGTVPGVVYTDTFLNAAVQSMSSQGARTSGSFLFADSTSYEFDAQGNWILVSDTFVVSDGSDLRVVVAPALRSASVSGSVSVETCTVDALGNSSCSDPVTEQVAGSWTATGATLRNTSTNHWHGPGISGTNTFQGAQRQAAASVTLGGVSFPGVLAFADINDAQSNMVSICHGAACP